jgi:pimeloyl-ACP methyl ester carboxylesterase
MTETIRYIRVDALDIAWQWHGELSPSPLVFLHGLGDSSIITFRRIAQHPALAGTSALLIDLPGFGHSPAPAEWTSTTEQQAGVVISVLDALGISGVPLMGHSMGGSIAILVATHRPDLVSRLIVAEPLLKPDQSILGKTIVKRPEAVFVTRGYDMLHLATRRQALRGDKAAQGFQEALRRADPTIMYRSAVSLLQERSPSLLALLETLPLPKTMLVGEKTDVEPCDLTAKGIAIVRIPDAGHSMMSENPDVFACAIASALRGA